MRLLGIDPGSTESGWCVIDAGTHKPVRHGKDDNHALIAAIRAGDFEDCDGAAVEMIRSYGMSVGAHVFQTCVWIGRFTEAIRLVHDAPPEPVLIYRGDVKVHHCHASKATDANVRQALVDRFACGVRNHGKGTKAAPGFFYGFKADVWQAYALAVYVADTTPFERNQDQVLADEGVLL